MATIRFHRCTLTGFNWKTDTLSHHDEQRSHHDDIRIRISTHHETVGDDGAVAVHLLLPSGSETLRTEWILLYIYIYNIHDSNYINIHYISDSELKVSFQKWWMDGRSQDMCTVHGLQEAVDIDHIMHISQTRFGAIFVLLTEVTFDLWWCVWSPVCVFRELFC